jgi:voltage-gated sodium channel
MQDAHSEEADQKTNTYRDEVLARLKAIEERMAQD